MTSKVGERIREARERAHLTQEQLGQKVGVSLRTIGNWERGTTVPKNRKAALEEVLGVDLDADIQIKRLPTQGGPAVALYAQYGADTPLEKIRVLQQLMNEVLSEQGGGEGDGK